LLGCFGAFVPCFCGCFNPYQTVPQGYTGLLSHFGKVHRIVDPGLHYVNPTTENITLVDIKVHIKDIPRQVVMSRDNVSVDLDSVIYWHVLDPFVATCHVSNVEQALMERTMTTLKDTVGAHDLQSLIAHREVIAREIKDIIEATAKSWGVAVEAILIKDLKFSRDLQENLSAAAKQRRLGESKVIAAQAEVEAARLMREASDILNTPAAMQIRYLDTLQTMSRSSDTKVIFMPMESGSGTSSSIRAMTDKFVMEQQLPPSSGKQPSSSDADL
jgi:erythrocyte band 7 integral membrane protein